VADEKGDNTPPSAAAPPGPTERVPASPADQRDDAEPAAVPAAAAPVPPAAAESDDQPGKTPAISPGGDVTVVPGVNRYHRSECILIRFLGPDDLEVMTRQAAEAASCVPCRACVPDKPVET
jgi:hypothetical protein